MPEDALHANSILSIWYKADTDAKKFRIKFTTKSLTSIVSGSADPTLTKVLSNRSSIITYGKKLDGTATNGVYKDADGYTQVPTAAITAAGRGTYGNPLSWRVTSSEEYEKEYGFKVISLAVS